MIILPRWFSGKERHASSADIASAAPVSVARQNAQKIVDLAILAEDDGDLELALKRIREAIEVDPQYARARLNLGNVLLAGGDIKGAISATLDAIRIDERYAEAHYNLGRLYGMTGDAASSEACFVKALELRPQFPQAAVALAGHFEKLNRVSDAHSWLRRALADDPHYELATFNLCRLLLAEGNVAEAEKELRRAVSNNPKLTKGYCALGDLCRTKSRWGEAIEWYAKAVAIDQSPETVESKSLHAQAVLELGLLLLQKDRWAEATAQLHVAAKLLPESAVPYVKLADMELRKARPVEAISLIEKAIERDPGWWTFKSFRLFTLNVLDDIDPQKLFSEHRRFGEWLEGATGRKIRAHKNSINADRALRVGYVSGDFRSHPIMIFILPVLQDHDRTRVQPFCYSNTLEPDDVTRDFERRFDGTWRDITGLTDDEITDLIVEDRIDILVDLSGHTQDSRLDVFAQKPAPIQVSWLGYLNTTGLKSMDYRLVDRYTDPVGLTEELHTERLVRLPDSQWAYWPILEVPVMRPERPSSPREIRFGSFNQYAKLSERALELWGQIMARVPEARLTVAGLPPENFEEHLLRRLEKRGIARARVKCAMRAPVMQYLQSYNEVDIALDSMPYNGATTTLDTLWMGVPVVGLVGKRSIARGTYSILKTLGMDELIAESPEQYVELNVRLATDAEWRNELHQSLRDRMRRSALTDIPRFTENLEAAYRGMWCDWCASQRDAEDT
jgi:protein O-GlcNAc transferase